MGDVGKLLRPLKDILLWVELDSHKWILLGLNGYCSTMLLSKCYLNGGEILQPKLIDVPGERCPEPVQVVPTSMDVILTA